eukprot:3840110-Rhodomonas_salina.1
MQEDGAGSEREGAQERKRGPSPAAAFYPAPPSALNEGECGECDESGECEYRVVAKDAVVAARAQISTQAQDFRIL